MKRSVIVLFILILLLSPLISSVEFDLNENFKQGETIITKVSGTFITSITKENIFFYRGHVRVPMEYDVAKIGDDYYIYALSTGKSPGDYSMSIENVQYMKGIEITDEKIIKNFSITNETADFFVKPGFVISPDNFYLEIQNLQDKEIIVDIKTETNISGKRDISISPEKIKESSISLKSGEMKKIYFELGAGEPTFQTIELSSYSTETITTNTSCFLIFGSCTGQSNVTTAFVYEVPVYIFSVLEEEPKKTFRFEPSEIISTIPANTSINKTIVLHNTGDEELKNISLSLSDSLNPFVNLSVNKIENLSTNSSFSVELSFFSSAEKEIEGDLKAETEDNATVLFISLKFLNNYIPSNESSSATKTCAELNGTLFNTETEKCDGDQPDAIDGWCCSGTITTIEKSSSGKIIAVVIIIVIVFILIWFYLRRYKKAKRAVDFLKLVKKEKIKF